MCCVFDNIGICFCILEIKYIIEEVKNVIVGNNEMYGELNDLFIILKDEKIIMIKFLKWFFFLK